MLLVAIGPRLAPRLNKPGVSGRFHEYMPYLGQGQIALWHAKQSLKLCLENGFGDIDLAFGYEAVARAYSIFGKGG